MFIRGATFIAGREERQRYQVRGDAISELDLAAVAHDRLAFAETDFHIVMLQKRPIERIDCLVDGFFRNEQQPAAIGVIIHPAPLGGSCDDLQQFGWKSFGRLDVYPDGCNVATHRDGGNGNPGIMRQGADDPAGQIGAPEGDLGTAHSGCPNCASSVRATMRAAPLARRTLTTLPANAAASSGIRACSSPGEINRWPATMPGTASASIAD